jgi:iron complex outermembrane receptor protein
VLHLILILAVLAVLAAGNSDAQGPKRSDSADLDLKLDDLSSLTLEQLTGIEVSSVARRDQQLYKTPAAVFVITQDDIRRSGASNIPELLRIVPGVQVAQVEAHKWAISIRGLTLPPPSVSLS